MEVSWEEERWTESARTVLARSLASRAVKADSIQALSWSRGTPFLLICRQIQSRASATIYVDRVLHRAVSWECKVSTTAFVVFWT